MSDTCGGGKVTLLQCADTGSTCVGIKSIVNNGDGTTTITLTNGNSTTYESQGEKGDTGATGAAGATEDAVLWNDVTDSTTATNAQETLKTFPMAAGQMSTDGDILSIRARFRANADAKSKLCYVYLGATLIASGEIKDTTTGLEFGVSLTRTDATAGKRDFWMDVKQTAFLFIYSQGRIYSALNAIAPTWANALAITIQANDQTGNPITCELFQVIYEPKT